MGALVIGAAAGVGCFIAAVKLKHIFGYDDSLDAFGVHGVGGIIGAILTGVFCAPSLGGAGFGDGIDNIAAQVGVQVVGILATLVYTLVMTYVILKVVDIILGLRVNEEAETEGLDISQHDERAYNL